MRMAQCSFDVLSFSSKVFFYSTKNALKQTHRCLMIEECQISFSIHSILRLSKKTIRSHRSTCADTSGLLAGFCFTTISAQTAASSNTDFIISYQSNAMEYRRLFYLLCSISLVGAIDNLLCLVSRIAHTGTRNRRGTSESDSPKGFMVNVCRAITLHGDSTMLVAVVMTVLYSIAFLSTLIMSKVDILIAVRGGFQKSASSAIWAASLLSSDGFQSDLSDWRSLNLVRLVCAILSWIGACYLTYKSVIAVEAKNAEVHRFLLLQCRAYVIHFFWSIHWRA